MMIMWLVACAATPKHVESRSAVDKLRATLGRAGIELRDDTFGEGNARCTMLGDKRNEGALAAVASALARYPTSVLDFADIKYVALCGALVTMHEGVETGPTGLAVQDSRGLLLDMGSMNDPALPWYDRIIGYADPREVVHHEIFHLLEYARHAKHMDRDPGWDALNPIGFVYTDANADGATIPGFVDVYSMTRITEDKATVYANLMTYPGWTCGKAATDEYLRAKLLLTRRRVKESTGTDEFLPPCILDPLIPAR